MVVEISAEEFVSLSESCPVVDVRSPGEFSQGHVSGAVNIPLFSDEERATVGTLYIKTGKDHAILKGIDLALDHLEDYLARLSSIAPPGRILLHCWRGGMRSMTMAHLFSAAGYDVRLLKGGYKAYRQFIRAELAVPRNVWILGGFTGSRKTEILKILAQNYQFIDLEGLANHKGSVFGAFGQLPQPSNEQFENDLFIEWNRLDPDKPVLMEDESRMIGRVTLPEPVYNSISTAPLIRIIVEKSVRIEHLVNSYAVFDKAMIADAIEKIRLRMGGDRANEALSALEHDDFRCIADIALTYYDKAYAHAIERRPGMEIYELDLPGSDIQEHARQIIDLLEKS